jgi:hypothetical protein
MKWMHTHPIDESGNDDPANLTTLCVACHAVLHIGRNLSQHAIDIWKAPLSQVESRDGIRRGLTLPQIRKSLKLKRGPNPEDSLECADELLRSIGTATRAYVPEPLCAVCLNFKQRQLE